MVISTPLIKAYARLGQKGAAAGIGAAPLWGGFFLQRSSVSGASKWQG